MKKLLLHTCCAPCLSGCYDPVKVEFEPVIFWFNPNIEPKEEHDKRLQVLKDYLQIVAPSQKLVCDYDYEKENKNWHEQIKGLENEPEGGKRCEKCFLFRLLKAAELAKEYEIPFTTTMTISPYKDSAMINNIGESLANENGIIFLKKDFRANDGYKKSIELSKKYLLYRQKYCGCKYSLND